MSHDQALLLQDRLDSVLEQVESEISLIENITSNEDLISLIKTVENFRVILAEVKNYFVEVRNQLSEVFGIPPAKELAQLVIGAATEALSALRETEHNLRELKGKIKGKRKTPISQEEVHYADFSSKVAIRKARYIINRISEQADNLPDQL